MVAGVAVGAFAVAVTPAAFGAIIGVSATGPVAGGMLAGKMAAYGGLVAGGFWASAQSFVMGGVGGAAIAAGGTAGGFLSWLRLQ